MFDLASYVRTGFPRAQDENDAYKRSMLWAVSPEYATGEVLLGGAYRTFVVSQAEGSIDLEAISDLAEAPSLGLGGAELEFWRTFIGSGDGIASPSPAGQRSRGGRVQSQLMPLVPEIARHANVLGSRRSRWSPGALVSATIAAGIGQAEWASFTSSFASALRVDAADDLLARYVEETLQKFSPAALVAPVRPAAPWRERTSRLTPSERFVDDLTHLVDLKPILTRRQWTVLIEACLRLGLGLHLIWLMRLNWGAWTHLLSVAEGAAADRAKTDMLWEAHHLEPLLEAGSEADSQIRRAIQKFVEARLGINVLLHGLDLAGTPFGLTVGSSPDSRDDLHGLAVHIEMNRHALMSTVNSACGLDLRRAVGSGIDARPRLLSLSSGFTKNIREYLRYSLGQLVPVDTAFHAYDQGYALVPVAGGRGRRRVELGPSTLIFLTAAAARESKSANTSIDAFREHLLAYGIQFPAGELGTGTTIRSLEELGLTIDSPDAGGGRTIHSPFGEGKPLE